LNILNKTKTLNELTIKLDVDTSKLSQTINESRLKLYREREKRVHPHKDDKILSDWNGLMVASLSLAGQAFNERKYVDAAK
jgi:uncharacterized protein